MPGRNRILVGVALSALALGLGFPAAAGELNPARTESWLLPDPDLHAVALRGQRAWAVGYWGTILRSTDGGQSWSYTESPTDAPLYDVSFADDDHGWAVGATGTLLRSTDGGQTWTPTSVTVTDPFDGSARELDATLFGVAAVSPREAWAVGDFGAVIHTVDGENWTAQVITPEELADENIPDRIFNSVHFSDSERGWITGEFGTTLRTTDGGQTWIGEREISGAIDDIYLFDIAPNGNGWTVAGGVGGVAIATSDAGTAWQAMDVPTTAGLFGAAVRGERGVLVGDRGVLLVSADAGASWRTPERPRSFAWLGGAVFGDNGLVLAVGEGGIILRSTDGGETWQRAMGHEPPPAAAVSVPEPARSLSQRRENAGE